jgi:putative transposase
MKQMAIQLITEAVACGARIHKACGVLGISCRTLRRWSEPAHELNDRRGQAARVRIHPQALTPEEKQAIVQVCNTPEHASLPPSQIVPRLADQGQYLASESSFYRVLKEHGQVNRRGKAQPPKKVAVPQAWVAYGANQVWSWDITYLPSTIKGQFMRLYMVLDVFSRMIVGWEVHWEESAENASTLIGKACLSQGVRQDQLALHSDNGSPMKAATMLATLQKLGVVPSFSRPSVSDDNPYSEALFRTLKFTPAYPRKRFEDLEQARAWVHEFVTWYNTQHRHSGIQFVTPGQRHAGQDKGILRKRKEVYEAAKCGKPGRWKSRQTRNWDRIKEVWLNPPREHLRSPESVAVAV